MRYVVTVYMHHRAFFMWCEGGHSSPPSHGHRDSSLKLGSNLYSIRVNLVVFTQAVAFLWLMMS